MSFGSCAAVLKTASRANPAVHLPYRPRARATPRTASRNVRRYDWSASSGSVVANDPVNRNDPDGKESGSVGYNSIVSLTEARAADNDPERARVEKQALIVGASLIPAGRVIGSIIRFVSRSTAAQNTTKAGTQAAERPKGVPKDFEPSSTSKGGGTKYTDPANPHNNVRDMPGNPNSPNPAQQNPYVKENVSGQPIDAAGRPVSGKSPESHIPRDQYQYRGKIKPDG
jgi:hypothetical protein